MKERFDRRAYLSQRGVDLVGGSARRGIIKGWSGGSKNSTTQEFLEAIAPAIVIISSGEDNPYGHPSPELLERLEASGARVLRTDRDGAVHIVTDGERLEISFFLACAELPTGDYFKTRGSAKSGPEQSAITKSRQLLAIHDFSYIEWARTPRCRCLRVWRETTLGKRGELPRRNDQNL